MTVAEPTFAWAMLVAGLCVQPIGIILLAIMIWLCYKRPEYRRKHYTAQTTGTVERMSNVYSCDIFVPLVRYTVDGTEYTVAGPRFAARTILTANVAGVQLLNSTCNITPDGELPLVVKMKGSMEAAQEAMRARYPKGKTVQVFYDPNAPKHAFVERDAPLSRKLSAILVSISGLITLLAFVLMLVGLLNII